MSGSLTPLPVVLTTAGLQPQAPAVLNAQLIAIAESLSPGLTANLPGSMIDDISGTATGALVVIDQTRVDLVNSLTPFGANAFILNQLGQIYGVAIGVGSNTGVFVVFTGSPGYVLPKGFTVSDGTFQYVLQDGGIINSTGTSQPLSALANQQGAWVVSPNTVTQLVTSVPSTVTLSVTNPLPGTPGIGSQTEEDYRSQVLQAGLASAQGMTSFMKSLIGNVLGVQQRLISVRQQIGGGWEVIVGGSGDPFEIGDAIFRSLFNISVLVGSTMNVTGITNANPAVVTTDINHGFSAGQVIQINGAVGISGINGINFTITVVSLKSFSIGINTTTSGTYAGGGVVTPNFRNVTVPIFDYPDTYTIPFVSPPQQTVAMVVTWNTSSGAFVSPVAVAQAAQAALVIYINNIAVGQPINLFELQATFQAATSGLIPTQLLTRMVFAVSINGVGVAPDTGTGIIEGDPESYFFTTPTSIIVNQG